MVQSSGPDYYRPWATPPATPDAIDAYLKRGRRPTHEHYLVCRNRDDAIAAVINLNEIVRGAFQSAYLGYHGCRSLGGRGYVTEGLRLVAKEAFLGLKLHRLEANVQPGNDRSRRVAERAGFRYEGLARRYLKIRGRWRDHEHWVLLREEWRGSG